MLVKFLVLAFIGCIAAQGVADSRCPTAKGQKLVRLPHETDCSRHWICQGGKKHLMPPCPRKKSFDSIKLKCVKSDEAVCGDVTEEPKVTYEPEVTDKSDVLNNSSEEKTKDKTTKAPPTVKELPPTAPEASTIASETSTLGDDTTTLGGDTTTISETTTTA